MKTSFRQVQPLARQFSDWVENLDSRPREKQLAIGTGIVATLFSWFAFALGNPLLLLAVPLLGGLLLGGVRAQRRLHPAEGPVEVTLERIAPRSEPPAATPAMPVEEPEEEDTESLLSRLSLAPPPPPVGRTSTSYVYEPEAAPEPEPLYEGDPGDEPEEELDARCYEVCETVAGRCLVRHTSPSLFGATDYALDLHVRSPGTDIEVVRVRGDARESVLRFSHHHPPEGTASAKSLLELFGYPVTRWKGPAG